MVSAPRFVAASVAMLTSMALAGCAEDMARNPAYPEPPVEPTRGAAIQSPPTSQAATAESPATATDAPDQAGVAAESSPEVAIGESPPPPAPQRQESGVPPTNVGDDLMSAPADPDGYADADPSALTDFRPALAPYGSWAEDPNYGEVWTPASTAVGADFAPYVTAGHWTYGDDYTWVSDYGWGWAPFHYGRWVYIGGRGWSWIPGRVYSGAWVTFRTGGPGYGYIGWAPTPPSWYWRNGYAFRLGARPPAPYIFCSTGRFFGPNVSRAVITGPQVSVIANGTRPYVAAAPTVLGSGRVLASPSVVQGGAHPALTLQHAPPPAALGLHPSAVPSPPVQNPGLARALSYSRATTGAAYGAAPPSPPALASSRPQFTNSSLPGGSAQAPRGPSPAANPSYTNRLPPIDPHFQGNVANRPPTTLPAIGAPSHYPATPSRIAPPQPSPGPVHLAAPPAHFAPSQPGPVRVAPAPMPQGHSFSPPPATHIQSMGAPPPHFSGGAPHGFSGGGGHVGGHSGHR